MVWSHWGRPHHNTTMIMKHVCGVIARRTGKPSKDVERRWAIEMGITLALRRARMAKRICPAIKDARGRYCVDGELGENVLTLSTCWEEVAEEDEATEE